MPIVTLQNGKSYSFPTQTAADAFKKEVGLVSNQPQTKQEAEPQNLLQRIQQGNKQKTDVFVGAGKEGLNLLRGASSLGERFLHGTLKTILPKSWENTLGIQKKTSKMTTGAEGLIPESAITPTNKYQKIGAGIAQIGEYMLPALGTTKAVNTGAKIANILSRAAQSGAIASAQAGGNVGKESVIATGTEIAFPVAGKVLKPVANVMGRLFGGFGAALSGASMSQISQFIDNPRVAKDVAEQIIKDGQDGILTANAKKIIDGASRLRREAVEKYGAGLEKLSKTDIKPSVIKKNVIGKLQDNKISISKNGVNLSNSEILDKKLQGRAKDLILKINSLTNASGKDVRNMLKTLETSKFKTAIEPNRVSFNSLVDDLYDGLKKSIKESTNKLSVIDKAYSDTLQLTEAIEDIFGKVNFKNKSELNNVARKLEGLFSKKALDPKTIDEFLIRIGEKPTEFKTSEAVRQTLNKQTGANTKGLTFAEITQQITSSVVTPQAILNLSIATGIAKEVLEKLVNNVEPVARGAVLKFLIDLNKE